MKQKKTALSQAAFYNKPTLINHYFLRGAHTRLLSAKPYKVHSLRSSFWQCHGHLVAINLSRINDLSNKVHDLQCRLWREIAVHMHYKTSIGRIRIHSEGIF